MAKKTLKNMDGEHISMLYDISSRLTIEFNTIEYKSHGTNHNSWSYLVRDMIANYASDNEVSLNELKTLLNSKVWISPLTDEVISENVPPNQDSFYMREEEKVQLSDCTVYVAKFDLARDAIEVAKLLNQEIKIS